MTRGILKASAAAACLLLLVGTFHVRAAAQDNPGKAGEEVKKLERAWLDAYEQNDAAAMDRIVAEGFLITFPNGSTQTKAQLMSMIRKPRPAGAPPPKFHTEGVEARVYGDTVILSGRVVSEFQQGGRAVREQSRYTDTYVRIEGRWQVVASHLSNAEEPKK